MTTSNVAYNSYYEHECRWGDTVYDTYVTIAPNLYRWDAYDVYASASYTETLTEPNGSTGSWSFSKSVNTSGGYSWLDNFSTRTYQRKETAYTITLVLGFNAGSSWSGSYHSVSSSATFTLTVPALSSVNVAYNANGGSGAPSTQKKYKGKTLTLSSTVPTRTGYNFLGWATSSSGAVAYQPGGTYTADTAVTLYAKWEQAIKPPTITLTTYRTTSSTASPTSDPTEVADGTYAFIKAVWAKGDNNVTGVQYRYKASTASSFSSWANMAGTITGAGSTARKGGISLPTTSYMDIEVKATDGTVTTTVASTIPTVTFPLYVYDQNKVRIHDLTVESGLVVNSIDMLTISHTEVTSGVNIYKCGRMCVLEIEKAANLNASWVTVTLGTAAAAYRPAHLVWGVAMSDNNSGLCATISIATDGKITASGRGGNAIGNETLHGQIVYFV